MSGKCARHGWIVATLLLALSAAPPAALADQKLSGSEIRAVAPGQWSGSYKSVPLKLTITKGGNLNGRYAGIPSSGVWQVSGSQFCFTVRALGEVKSKCGALHMNGTRLYGFFNRRGKARLVLNRL